MYPQGSCRIKLWGYRIILRRRDEEYLLESDALSPQNVSRAHASDLIKSSRTCRVYKIKLAEEQIVYYKIDNCRGPIDFVKNVFRPSRARRAWRELNRLKLCGIPVPPLVLCAEKRHGILWAGSFLVTREIPGALSLDAYVADVLQNGSLPPDKKRRIIADLAGFVRRLHDLKLYHADLKGANILITDGDEGFRFHLIDADRVKFKKIMTFRKKIRNLLQLSASLSCVSVTDRLRFFSYYAGKGRNPAKRRTLEKMNRLTERRFKQAPLRGTGG